MAITTCVFDAYGTLFDVSAAAREAAALPENAILADIWPKLANEWRLKQLQYTWLRAITKAHCDFWQVTQEGLDWALAANHIEDKRIRQVLLDLYWNLSAYEEAAGVLAQLKEVGITTAILSNGSPEMLAAATRSAGLTAHLDALLSVETVGVFKPDARVYDLVGTELGCAKDQVLFVSSNGWDVAGATGYGFNTLWVNRAGEPVDQLPWKPQTIKTDLSAVPTLAGVQS